jgi:glycosyltransferase involved in cell wall biosynthesis
MKISIIIPAYNEEKYIEKTLRSINEAIEFYRNENEVEVIVVNNDSNDKTEDIAKENGARVVFETKRQIARARNTGAKYAVGKYLVFIDADTIIDNNILKRIDELLSSGKVIGGGAFIYFDHYWDVKLIARVTNYLCLIFKIPWGAFLFCKKESFEKIGGFDETLYGLEELYFSRALIKKGKRSNKKFKIISDMKVITSARRLKSLWHIIKTRVPLLWNLKRKIKDKRYCDPIWYDVER